MQEKTQVKLFKYFSIGNLVRHVKHYKTNNYTQPVASIPSCTWWAQLAPSEK